jgi:hypothetical protein
MIMGIAIPPFCGLRKGPRLKNVASSLAEMRLFLTTPQVGLALAPLTWFWVLLERQSWVDLLALMRKIRAQVLEISRKEVQVSEERMILGLVGLHVASFNWQKLRCTATLQSSLEAEVRVDHGGPFKIIL